MRALTAILCISVIALSGCASSGPPERRSVSLSWEPHVDIVCELRAYRIDSRIYDRREFEAMSKATAQDLRYHVRGFLWVIVSPRQFAGKALSSHFDGPLASGDPFEAFT